MKNMKKLLSVTMALVMVFGFAMFTARATEPTITITNAQDGITYYAYKLLDVASFSTGQNGELTAVAYKADGDQYEFLNAANPKLFNFEQIANSDPVEYNAVLVEGKTASDIAKYVKEEESKNNPSLKKLVKTPFTNNVSAKTSSADVQPGYYYVNTTTGTAVELATVTSGTKVISDKSDDSFKKEAKKDGDASYSGETVKDIKVGETVDYKISFKVYPGATGVKVTDVLEKGLTYQTDNAGKVAISVTLDPNDSNINGEPSVPTEIKNQDGEVTSTTFNVTFNGEFKAETTVTITYKATVNAEAVYDVDELTNTATLNKDNSASHESTAKVQLYQFAINKFEMVDNQKTNLAGVEFKLLDSEGEDINYKFIAVKDNTEPNKILFYRPALSMDSEESKVDTFTTNSDGNIVVKGLAGGSYQLKETKALDGYNALTYIPSVVEEKTGSDAEQAKQILLQTQNPQNVSFGNIENKKGSQLPETGGMGTTLFYVFGGLLLVGAGVFMITNKRMQKN